VSTASALSLVIVAVLILITAVVGAIETVVTRLSVVRALRMNEEELPGAGALLWLLEHRSRTLNVVLLLTLFLRVIAAGLLGIVAFRQLGGVPAATVALLLFLAASFVLAEVAPRTFALRHIEQTGRRLAPTFAALTRILDPLVRPLVALGRSFVPSRAEVSGPFAPDEEVRALVDEEADDEIEADERAMIESIFELGETVAREIMVPRPDMVTVGAHEPFRVVVSNLVESGYSRLPVYRENDRDEIVGVVYAKDVLERLAADPDNGEWSDLVREPTYVPETKRSAELLRELQEAKIHLAIVVDEYGAMVGLVTIEDILEEIVGEIVDEHDQEEVLVETLGDDGLRIDARLSVDDLNELLHAELPDDDWDTVGGLVLGMLGKVPRPGDQVTIDGLTLVAERVQGRRVSKVLVRRCAEDVEPERVP